MKILAIEMSSAQRSVGAWLADAGGKSLIATECVDSGSQEIPSFEMIETVLDQAGWERADIDCLAVGIGPGSYTGIRSAIAIAQGWALAMPVKLAGVSSAEAVVLECQAMGVRGLLHVVIDAQRGEVYLATYDVGSEESRCVEPLHLVTPERAHDAGRCGGIIVGPEACRWFPGARIIHPRALGVAKLASMSGTVVAPEQLEPIYLRATSFVKAPPARNDLA